MRYKNYPYPQTPPYDPCGCGNPIAPVAATPDMTDEVGFKDGRLYTYPIVRADEQEQATPDQTTPAGLNSDGQIVTKPIGDEVYAEDAPENIDPYRSVIKMGSGELMSYDPLYDAVAPDATQTEEVGVVNGKAYTRPVQVYQGKAKDTTQTAEVGIADGKAYTKPIGDELYAEAKDFASEPNKYNNVVQYQGSYSDFNGMLYAYNPIYGTSEGTEGILLGDDTVYLDTDRGVLGLPYSIISPTVGTTTALSPAIEVNTTTDTYNNPYCKLYQYLRTTSLDYDKMIVYMGPNLGKYWYGNAYTVYGVRYRKSTYTDELYAVIGVGSLRVTNSSYDPSVTKDWTPDMFGITFPAPDNGSVTVSVQSIEGASFYDSAGSAPSTSYPELPSGWLYSNDGNHKLCWNNAGAYIGPTELTPAVKTSSGVRAIFKISLNYNH